MENQSNYRLKEKYNGLPLEFGSSIYVTNANITDAYAKKLLKNYKAESIFDVFPKEEINVVVETATETKVRAPRRATSKKIKND